MATKRERLVFLDVLRLIAAAQMIQGHAIAAVLAPAFQRGTLYAAWTFARGWTSVMFMFAAGYSCALAERSEAAERRRATRRPLQLIALGYLMHAPFAILLGAPREATLRSAVVVDVLQCIGVSLLLLGIRWGDALWRSVFFLGLACLCLAVGPLRIPVDGWRPLANFFTSQGGSLFPLIPWFGFVAAGYGLGVLGRRQPAMVPLQLLVAAVCAFAFLAQPFVKLGCVLLIAAGLAWQVRTLPPLLLRLSRETLFLYVSHVVILYADQVGLQARWGGRLSPWFGVGLAVVLMLVCGAGSLAWRGLRAGGRKLPQL